MVYDRLNMLTKGNTVDEDEIEQRYFMRMVELAKVKLRKLSKAELLVLARHYKVAYADEMLKGDLIDEVVDLYVCDQEGF